MHLNPMKLGKALAKTSLVFYAIILISMLFVPTYQPFFVPAVIYLLFIAIAWYFIGYVIAYFYNKSKG